MHFIHIYLYEKYLNNNKENKKGFYLNRSAWCTAHVIEIILDLFATINSLIFWSLPHFGLQKSAFDWSMWTWYFCFLRWNDFIFFVMLCFFGRFKFYWLFCAIFSVYFGRISFYESKSSIFVEQWSSKLMILFCYFLCSFLFSMCVFETIIVPTLLALP